MAPWNRYKECKLADGEAPEEVEATATVRNDNIPATIIIETSERAPREFYIRKAHAEKHGCTRRLWWLCQLVQRVSEATTL